MRYFSTTIVTLMLCCSSVHAVQWGYAGVKVSQYKAESHDQDPYGETGTGESQVCMAQCMDFYTKGNGKDIDGYSRTPNAAISGHNNKHLSNVRPEDCASACDNETSFDCKSFDYYKNSNECDLSSKNASDTGGLTTNYDGNPYDHYSK